MTPRLSLAASVYVGIWVTWSALLCMAVGS